MLSERTSWEQIWGNCAECFIPSQSSQSMQKKINKNKLNVIDLYLQESFLFYFVLKIRVFEFWIMCVHKLVLL